MWKSVSKVLPADLELAWLEWLCAAEAAWSRIRDLCGTQRRPFLERSKGLVIEHVSLGHATRNDTRRRCSKKAAAWRAFRRLVAQAVGSLAGWSKGRASQGTLQQSVQLARLHLVTRSWSLGSRLGFSVAGSHDTLSAQSCNLWRLGPSRSQGSWFSSRVTHSKQSTLRQWIRHVVGGDGRRKLARDLREQRMASQRLASTSAMAMGWLGRSSWSIKWGRGCRSGWIRAEPTPSSLPTRRIWESPCQDLHSKRSIMCARHTSTPQDLVTTASTPRIFCSCQSNCECVSSTCSWRSRQSLTNR